MATTEPRPLIGENQTAGDDGIARLLTEAAVAYRRRRYLRMPSAENLLRWLLRAPLTSNDELCRMSGHSLPTVSRAMRQLVAQECVARVRAGAPGIARAQRYFLTPHGLDVIAEAEEIDVEQLLDHFPVSREWLHGLLRRFDGIAAIYRLAGLLAEAYGAKDFRWYRSIALDLGIAFGDFNVAIHREGPLATLWHRRRRLRGIEESHNHPIFLVLVDDELRALDWWSRLERLHLAGAVAVEHEMLAADDVEAPIWRSTSEWAGGRVALTTALDRLDGGPLPHDDDGYEAHLPPESLIVPVRQSQTKDYHLPLLLVPFEKKVLEWVGRWPYVCLKDLADCLGVSVQAVKQTLYPLAHRGLVDRRGFLGERQGRWFLTDRGLLLLGRRDRLPAPQLLDLWSGAPVDRQAPYVPQNIRGRRMRTLVRSLRHTGRVYRFLAVMAVQARRWGHVLEAVEVFHRAWRGYAANDGQPYLVRPDGYGAMRLRSGGRPSFFLEWEMRADRPGRYLAKLRPYLRYYQCGAPEAELGDWPYVFFVLRDGVAEAGLLQAAKQELYRYGVDRVLRLLTTTEALVARHGPLSAIWREWPGQTRTTPRPIARL